jgi:MFS family permease
MAERNRRRIAVLIYSMVNAVIFGTGLITVLLVPPLKAHLGFWIVVVVITSFVLAVPIAWLLAPRLQARYDRKRQLEGSVTPRA